MMNIHKKKNSGFSLLELLIVLAIMAFVARIITLSLVSFNSDQSVDKTTLTLLAVLDSAQSTARASKNAANQGVRIYSNQIVAFEGTYGTKNSTTTLSSLVTISTSTGIGTDIIFQNLTGFTTSASGTITISQKNNPAKNQVIQVYTTGIIEKK